MSQSKLRLFRICRCDSWNCHSLKLLYKYDGKLVHRIQLNLIEILIWSIVAMLIYLLAFTLLIRRGKQIIMAYTHTHILAQPKLKPKIQICNVKACLYTANTDAAAGFPFFFIVTLILHAVSMWSSAEMFGIFFDRLSVWAPFFRFPKWYFWEM